MRENRTYGSEGGEANAFPTPIGFPIRGSLAEMLVEEPRDLGEDLLGLRRRGVEIVLGVRHALVDLKLCFDPGAAKLAVRKHGEAQEQVASAAGEDRRRKAGKSP